ncbi:MAG: DUF2203 domain-containing protein [Dehalococcoidia bacterium]
MERRLFTLDEARSHLPKLREILPGLMDAVREAEPLREQMAAIQRATAGNGHVVDDDVAARRRRLEQLAETINEVLQELNQLGIEMKDLVRGLVDFPSRRDDRVVYLCWLYDEEDIQYWHELDAGFAGRQPL